MSANPSHTKSDTYTPFRRDRRVRLQIFLMMMISLAVLSLTNGCDRSAPDDLIDEDRYITILAELHVLAAMREMREDEDAFREGQRTVLEHYDVSRDQFERSHDYYIRDVKEKQRRMRDVRRQLEEISSELSDYERKLRRYRDLESITEPDADSAGPPDTDSAGPPDADSAGPPDEASTDASDAASTGEANLDSTPDAPSDSGK